MPTLDLNQIARQVYPLLRHRALYLTRDSAGADDLVQSTLERLLTRAPGFLCNDHVLPWLFVVMRHLFVDGTKTMQARWQPLREDEPLPAPAPTEPESEPVWSAVGGHDVDAALVTLNESLRRTYELRVRAKMSYREIARSLGVDINTVGTRLHRARRHLRRALLPSVASARRRGAQSRRSNRSGKRGRDCQDTEASRSAA